MYLKANAYNDDYSSLQSFTLYVSLDFCIDDRMTYEFGGISLKQPERDRIKLDDYLIPVLGMREVNAAAEDLLFEYMPEALHDYKLLDPFKLARKMGLEVAYHKLYKNHKTKSVLYWFDSEVKVTPRNGDDKAPPIVVKIPAGTILINENAVHRDRARSHAGLRCCGVGAGQRCESHPSEWTLVHGREHRRSADGAPHGEGRPAQEQESLERPGEAY